MEENNYDYLIEKIVKLNEIEQNKSKILVVTYIKTIGRIKERKLSLLQNDFKDQLEFYNQKMNKYEYIYKNILSNYEDSLEKMIDKYNEIYINMQLELQEAQSNQKIAIVNLIKSYTAKRVYMNSEDVDGEILAEFDEKIEACLNRKKEYDQIIENCQTNLEDTINNIQKEIKLIFKDYSNQVVPLQENFIKLFFNKIANKFTGASKFNTFVIEPMIIENEKIEKQLPKVLDDIEEQIVDFVAKIKKIKNQINSNFEKTLNS